MLLRSLVRPGQLAMIWRRSVASQALKVEPEPPATATLFHRFVTVNWKDGHTSSYHFPWLKDHCPSMVIPDSGQKLHHSGSPHILAAGAPTSVAIANDQLVVKWADNTESQFDLTWLRQNGYDDVSRQARAEQRKPVLWTRETLEKDFPEVSYHDIVHNDRTLWKALNSLHKYGLVFVRHVPVELDASLNVSKRIGPLRDTFYGLLWDVKSVPRATNIAYTSVMLGLHQDLLYFEAPPGMQLLHCLKNSVSGGYALFLDSFKAAEILKESNPAAFDLLHKCPITYHYRRQNRYRRYSHPLFEADEMNEGFRVNYSPPFQAPLDMPFEQMDAFYHAFAEWESILQRPDLLLKTRYNPGDLVIFNNRRVLHGRTAFNDTSGERHLRGSYVDLDEFRDTWRVYSERFGQ